VVFESAEARACVA